MQPYKNMQLTASARNMLAESLAAGKALRLVKVGYSETSSEDLEFASTLPAQQDEVSISELTAEQGRVGLSATFRNRSDVARTVNSIGIYALDSLDRELLFAYTTILDPSKPNVLPAQTALNGAELILVFELYLGNANISLTVPSTAYVARHEVQALLDSMQDEAAEVKATAAQLTAALLKLDHIEAGANKTTIANTLNEQAQGKALDAVQGKVLAEQIALKVDKVQGKVLSSCDYSALEQSKLAGIAEGANRTEVENSLASNSTTAALAVAQGRQLYERVGELASLNTTAKTNTVDAVNEVYGQVAALQEQLRPKTASTETDLDSLKTQGAYLLSGGNTYTNLPTGQTWGVLQVIDGGVFKVQLFIGGASINHRIWAGSNWTPWRKITSTT